MSTEIYPNVSPTQERSPFKRQVLADSALVGVTMIWGTSFVLVKDVLEQVPPMTFLAMRFAIGALALAVVVALSGRWRGLTVRELAWGTLIGVVLWAGYALQTLGLQHTTASNGGFITGLSVVMVPPLAALMLKQRPHRWAAVGVAMAAIGMAFLSLRFDEGIKVNYGDALVLGCAVAFAFHIVLLSHVAPWCDPLRMAMVQILVAGVLNALGAVVAGQQVAGVEPELWAAAAYLGIMSTALGISVQVAVQRFTSAVHAALIYTLEPVFAAAFGVWLQGDVFGPVALFGAVLILGGMLVAELGPFLRTRLNGSLRTTKPQE